MCSSATMFMPFKPMLSRAVVLLAAQGSAAAIGAAATLALIATMGAAAFGQATLVIATATLAAVLVNGNLDALALRRLTQGSAGAKAAFLRESVLVTVGLSLGIALVLGGIVAVGWAPPWVLGVAVLAPVLAVLRFNARCGTALDAPLAGVLPRLLSRPMGFALLACFAWATGWAPIWWAMPLMLFGASLFGIALQYARLTPKMRPLWRTPPDLGPLIPDLRQAGHMIPGLMFLEYFRDLVIFSASWSLPREDLGVLSLALTFAVLPGLALVAVDVASSARIAKGVAARDAVQTHQALREALALRWLGLILCLAGLALCLGWVQRLAGTQGLAPLIWSLTSVPIVRAALGNTQQLLLLQGQTATVFHTTTLAIIFGLPAILVSAWLWGPMGAATAAAGLHMAVALVLWSRCRRLTGLDPSVFLLSRRTDAARGRRDKSLCPAPRECASDPSALVKA